MTPAPAGDRRTAAIRKLHTIVRQHGIDKDTYRDRLFLATGQRSAADCTDEELQKALAAFHVKQSANSPYAAKIKALFIAAYNLGLFSSGTDLTLDGFIKRQTGKERLTFVGAVDANRVTEALKAMLVREGFIVPDNDQGGMEARKCLLRAQWAKLHSIGAVRIAHTDALDSWLSYKIVPHKTSHAGLKRHELDQCAIQLGRWIRKHIAKKPPRPVEGQR